MGMWKRKRQQVQTTVPETLSELAWGKLGLWGIPLKILWAVIHRTAFGFCLLVSTLVGRVVAGVGAGALLLDAGFDDDPVALPVSPWAVFGAALVFGAFCYARRRRWEQHVENAIFNVVPGHTGLDPALVWFLPRPLRLQLGRWFGTWRFGFRVPTAMKEKDEMEVTTQLRSRLPAARGSSWMLSWDWRSGKATAAIKEDMPDSLSRDELLLRIENEGGGDRDRIPLGVSVDGVEYFDVEETPHLLNTGETGNGKSVSQLGILCHAMTFCESWSIVACDPKKVELGYLAGRPGVRTVARDLEGIVKAIKEVEAEMDRRFEDMQAAGVNHIRKLDQHAKRWLLVVDELQQVTMPSNAKDEESKASDALKLRGRAALERIAALGRAAGCHQCLTTQRPDVGTGILTGPLKFNLSGRLACGPMDQTASSMALDTDAATMLPRRPKGRAVWRGIAGEKQIQVVFTKEEDLPKKG